MAAVVEKLAAVLDRLGVLWAWCWSRRCLFVAAEAAEDWRALETLQVRQESCFTQCRHLEYL